MSNSTELCLDNESVLRDLCGVLNENLNLIEKLFSVIIYNKGIHFRIVGLRSRVVAELLKNLSTRLENRKTTQQDIQQEIHMKSCQNIVGDDAEHLLIHTPKRTIETQTTAQTEFVKAIRQKSLVFGAGPAGVGKTFLAVAHAVELFQQGLIEKIILTRPVIEAGENLGFLPGDILQKTDPYMRPLYDALFTTMGTEAQKLIAQKSIEIAPLAFMRGRTLNGACIILDEAQNATISQIYMFLTRLGAKSNMIIVGDTSQIDLPNKQSSGLAHSINILEKKSPQIQVCKFDTRDIMRNSLVQIIINAYDAER